jgi:hypothetical protein
MSVAPPALQLLRNVTKRGPIVRFGARIAVDAGAWLVAVFAAGILRFELDLSKVVWLSFAVVAVLLIAVQIALGLALFLYRGRCSSSATRSASRAARSCSRRPSRSSS